MIFMLKKWTESQLAVTMEKAQPLSGQGKDTSESKILTADVKNYNEEKQSVNGSKDTGGMPAGSVTDRILAGVGPWVHLPSQCWDTI